jgi:hypothetical protein
MERHPWFTCRKTSKMSALPKEAHPGYCHSFWRRHLKGAHCKLGSISQQWHLNFFHFQKVTTASPDKRTQQKVIDESLGEPEVGALSCSSELGKQEAQPLSYSRGHLS